MRILLLILAAALAVAALLILHHILRLRAADLPEVEAQDDFALAMRRWSDLEGNR